jgi:hypothetical protein
MALPSQRAIEPSHISLNQGGFDDMFHLTESNNFDGTPYVWGSLYGPASASSNTDGDGPAEDGSKKKKV